MSNVATRQAIGIDFGGTSVKMGLMDEQGCLVRKTAFSTAGLSGVPGWLEAVGQAMSGLGLRQENLAQQVSGIGVGVPGFVDYQRGFIHDLTNVPGWTAVSLRDLLQERFAVKAVVDNDANVMALGEVRFGAGRDFRYAVFVTLGTGVGGGLVLDGQLYRGAHSMAGEIGHISIERNGIRSPQGRGGLEQYVGNRRLVEWVLTQLKLGRQSILPSLVGGDISKIEVKTVQEAAYKGDVLSLDMYDYMADCLATAFSSLTYILQPEVFIVGGGVAYAGDILFEPIRRHLADRLSPHFAKLVQVMPAGLGNDAGMVGAAALAM